MDSKKYKETIDSRIIPDYILPNYKAIKQQGRKKSGQE